MEIKCISSGTGYTDPRWNEQRLITYPVKKISKEYRNFQWQSMMNISVAILRLRTHIWNRRRSSTPSGMSLWDRRHSGYWREHYVIAEDTNIFGQCTKLQRCSDMKIFTCKSWKWRKLRDKVFQGLHHTSRINGRHSKNFSIGSSHSIISGIPLSQCTDLKDFSSYVHIFFM